MLKVGDRYYKVTGLPGNPVWEFEIVATSGGKAIVRGPYDGRGLDIEDLAYFGCKAQPTPEAAVEAHAASIEADAKSLRSRAADCDKSAKSWRRRSKRVCANVVRLPSPAVTP